MDASKKLFYAVIASLCLGSIMLLTRQPQNPEQHTLELYSQLSDLKLLNKQWTASQLESRSQFREIKELYAQTLELHKQWNRQNGFYRHYLSAKIGQKQQLISLKQKDLANKLWPPP